MLGSVVRELFRATSILRGNMTSAFNFSLASWLYSASFVNAFGFKKNKVCWRRAFIIISSSYAVERCINFFWPMHCAKATRRSNISLSEPCIELRRFELYINFCLTCCKAWHWWRNLPASFCLPWKQMYMLPLFSSCLFWLETESLFGTFPELGKEICIFLSEFEA